MDASVPEGIHPTNPKVIGVVGTGLIGAGWCTLFLAKGHTVIATDTAPDAESRCRDQIRKMWKILIARGLVSDCEDASSSESLESTMENFSFTTSILDCVSKADFVQEQVYERMDVKHHVMHEIDKYAPPTTLVASSSSFIPLNILAAACKYHPDRIVTAHPAQPHVSPFLEIYAVSHDHTEALRSFYGGCGMDVIVMKKPVQGHILNSLLDAVLAKSAELAKDGACDPEDIDRTVMHLARALSLGISVPLLAVGGKKGAAGVIDIVVAKTTNHGNVIGGQAILWLFGSYKSLSQLLLTWWFRGYDFLSRLFIERTVRQKVKEETECMISYCDNEFIRYFDNDNEKLSDATMEASNGIETIQSKFLGLLN